MRGPPPSAGGLSAGEETEDMATRERGAVQSCPPGPPMVMLFQRRLVRLPRRAGRPGTRLQREKEVGEG